ncbi:hypothetical protein L1887_15104 [Cichorium endivia]|nr:hypothetical protein L1887_15104 [Cichorium endivia]
MLHIMSQTSGARESYLARYRALWQLKFLDYQGPSIQILSIDKLLEGSVSLNGHRARITSMRLFPLKETSLFQNETQINENVLVTSSCDHSIRLWWKGSCQRCFRGHNGPVTILSDKLLGDGTGKVFASGGEDSTVRLWSLNSSGKRGQGGLKATLNGHKKPLVLMCVSGLNPSLISSMSKDSKFRVWDTTISSDRSSCCVGITSVPGVPVGMKCHDSLLYIAAGSSFGAVDLRTMKTAFRTSTNQAKLFSFDVMPSKFLACTGGFGRAMLWDIRRSTGTGDADVMAELGGHVGPVRHLHMDPYKIITRDGAGCCGMAADGFRIVTAGCSQEECVLTITDFRNSIICPLFSENVDGSCPSTSGNTDDESDG